MWRLQWSLFITAVIALLLYNAFVNITVFRPNLCSKPTLQYQTDSYNFRTASMLAMQSIAACVCDQTQSEDPLSMLDTRLGKWDSSRIYKTFDNVALGIDYAELSSYRRVCLATQSSLERIASFIEIGENWSGPISLALYAAGEQLRLIRAFVMYLKVCYPGIYVKTAIHILLVTEKEPVLEVSPEVLQLIEGCMRPKDFVKKLVETISKDTIKWLEKALYPQNHLRNLARKNCQTSYVFLVDVDIIPSVGASEGLDKFLEKDIKCRLCAFVVPTYELDENVTFPQNKTELLRYARKGKAIPFHKKVFIHNQHASNLSRWEKSGGKENSNIHISHPVTNFELLYEPFYVAQDNVPPHDERFMGYGFTRNTQVYEMYVIGYKFQVLSPIFTIHWGIQNRRNRPAWRERQTYRNRRNFDVFKREVFARYRKDPLHVMPKPSALKDKNHAGKR